MQSCGLSDEERNKNKVKITVTYYMVCQKRSSGSIYYSSRRYTFIVGIISKCVIGVFLYSNAYLKCDDEENMREESEEHKFPNNFEGRSKSTEAGAIMKMG